MPSLNFWDGSKKPMSAAFQVVSLVASWPGVPCVPGGPWLPRSPRSPRKRSATSGTTSRTMPPSRSPSSSARQASSKAVRSRDHPAEPGAPARLSETRPPLSWNLSVYSKQSGVCGSIGYVAAEGGLGPAAAAVEEALERVLSTGRPSGRAGGWMDGSTVKVMCTVNLMKSLTALVRTDLSMGQATREGSSELGRRGSDVALSVTC